VWFGDYATEESARCRRVHRLLSKCAGYHRFAMTNLASSIGCGWAELAGSLSTVRSETAAVCRPWVTTIRESGVAVLLRSRINFYKRHHPNKTAVCNVASVQNRIARAVTGSKEALSAWILCVRLYGVKITLSFWEQRIGAARRPIAAWGAKDFCFDRTTICFCATDTCGATATRPRGLFITH
jgi:hypothetical protein